MERDANPLHTLDGSPIPDVDLTTTRGDRIMEPNPEGGEPDLRALYADEAVYYFTATGMETVVLGYVLADLAVAMGVGTGRTSESAAARSPWS